MKNQTSTSAMSFFSHKLSQLAQLSFIFLLGLLFLLLNGCSDKHSEPNIELVQDMMVQPALRAQGEDPDAIDRRGMRVPPDGTVPMGWDPYTITDFDVANNTLKNPIENSREVFLRGQKLYFTYCNVCHGEFGHGDGPVAPKMLLTPPPLVSQKIRGWNDGGIYHLITKGRGLMGSYESQIPSSKDRWAIVNYVRHLQKNGEVVNTSPVTK